MVKLNLIGSVFGQITVLSEAPSTPSGKARWQCVCSCGVFTTTSTSNLRTKHSSSCGHDRTNNSKAARNKERNKLFGLRFGRLLVLEQTETVSYRTGPTKALYKCQCDCGVITWQTAQLLRNGKEPSCGCFITEHKSRFAVRMRAAGKWSGSHTADGWRNRQRIYKGVFMLNFAKEERLFVSKSEAAAMCGVGLLLMNKIIINNNIETRRVGSRILVSLQSLKTWANSTEAK